MKAKQPAEISEQTSSTSKFLNVQSLYLFLVFPLFLLVEGILLAQYVHAIYKIPIPTIAAILIALLFFLILAAYFLYKQHAKRKAQQDYQELLGMQQYQKKHYERIQQQRVYLEKIKNHFESYLTDLCSLLDSGKEAEALNLLQNLTKEIESTKEYPFCPNPVINAVLGNKKQLCGEHQIAFHADLQIGSCGSIDQLHLCSIFSNLLDNAIEASKLVTPPAERYVQLTARQSGDYLHIKVKNSSLPPINSSAANPSSPLLSQRGFRPLTRPETLCGTVRDAAVPGSAVGTVRDSAVHSSAASHKKGHGYGQKILADIAANYSGTFRTSYEDHTYEAYLCVRMP